MLENIIFCQLVFVFGLARSQSVDWLTEGRIFFVASFLWRVHRPNMQMRESQAEREHARVHFRTRKWESESHVRDRFSQRKWILRSRQEENLYLAFPQYFPFQIEYLFCLISSVLQWPFLSFSHSLFTALSLSLCWCIHKYRIYMDLSEA